MGGLQQATHPHAALICTRNLKPYVAPLPHVTRKGAAVLNAEPRINPHRGRNTCLIVEDSDFDRERMSRVVRKSRSDIQISEAPTLSIARETLEKGGISLILLDNHLPDGLGAEFAQELAQNPDCASIPIIIVSDWPTPFMWEKAASAGVIYVLNKSEFDARYMRAALDTLPRQRAS